MIAVEEPLVLRRRPLRVAFVACNRNRRRFLEDPSFLYRCQNLAGALHAAGHEALLTHVSRLNPFAAADLVVFHRPRNTLAFRAAIAVLRRRRVRVIADVDDLVFDPALAAYSPGVRNGLVPLADMQALFTAHYKALAAFDLISVSTEPLADEVRRLFPNAAVTRLPNAVHYTWRRAPEPRPERFEKLPAITYLPGTRSHDRDFAIILPTLGRLLARHPQLCLQVTGPVAFDLPARPGQVRRFPKLPFRELHWRVRSGWLNLAPLEPTPFTRCKSALKVLEAGYWGIPTLSSPLPDARRFTDAGALVCGSGEEWEHEIERLLLDPDRYAAVTAGLRQKVLARADVHAAARDLVTFTGCEAAAA